MKEQRDPAVDWRNALVLAVDSINGRAASADQKGEVQAAAAYRQAVLDLKYEYERVEARL